VIADRGPGSANTEHSIEPATVEAELLRDGFEIASRDDRFLIQPQDGAWWLIVAEAAKTEASLLIMRHTR
jgi:hypothetical protein